MIPWIDKVKEIAAKTNTLRIYFNNHHGGKAVINTLQFKDMLELLVSYKKCIIPCKELIFKNYFGYYKRSNICNKFTK